MTSPFRARRGQGSAGGASVQAVLILACVVAALCPRTSRAQDVSVPTLKAAFLMNFVKFAEWPDGAIPPGRVFTFCVSGDDTVFNEVALSIKRNSRPGLMAVTSVAAEGPSTACDMLYLGGSDLQAARRMIDSLQGAPVFTVSDIRGFAEAGGIAQLRLESGKMRFTINPTAANRSRIQLSAKLLSLATLVGETPHDRR